MSSNEKCPEIVVPGDDWSPPCGKPIKRNGLCGVHANKADRDAETRRLLAAERETADEAARLAAALTAHLAIPFTNNRTSVWLSIDAAKRLLDIVGGAE